MFTTTLPVGALRSAFAVLAKLVPDRVTLPVLGHIRIERVENRINLAATDLDRWLTFTHLVEPEPITALAKTLASFRWPREAGALLVPKLTLRDALKAADRDSAITFSVRDNPPSTPPTEEDDPPTRCTVLVSYQMNGQPITSPVESWRPDDFPPEPEIRTARPCVADLDARSSLIEAGQFASTDSSRYVLNGVYIETRCGNQATPPFVVATDGRRLYRRSVPAFARLNTNLIIPSGAIDLLGQAALLGHDWHFFTDRKAEHVRFIAGPWKLVSRLVEGNFPNYRQVIPSESAARASLGSGPHKQLVEILGKLPAPPKGKTESITLRFQPGRLGIEDPHSQSSLIVSGIPLLGPPRVIHLNRYFLRELLATGPGTFHLTDEMSPVRYETTRQALHVLMPMRAA